MSAQSTGPDLIRGLKEEDPDALAAAYRAHHRMVYDTAFQLVRSRENAEDIVQDVFIGLPEATRKFDGHGSFSGWLRQITVRVALTALRQAKRKRDVLRRVRWTLPTSRDPVPVTDVVAVDRALAALPARLRAVFVLKEVHGYSHREIADMLSTTPGGSAQLLLRARRRLARSLGRSV